MFERHTDIVFQDQTVQDLGSEEGPRGSHQVTPLGVQLGYGAGRRPSSLILARRVALAAAPAPVQTPPQR